MKKGIVVSAMALAALLWFVPAAYAQQRQPGAVYDFDREGETPGPAPRRDISGIWEPADGPNRGIQANGAQMMPSDGRPEHELPFTALGRETFLARKPSVGVTAVTPALTDDPVKGGETGTGCDPVGFPRLALWNLRTSRIIQTPENVVILYLFAKKWRVIRTDLEELPTEFDEPRWFGYSVGGWEDDYTFVAQSAGFDERTWLDAAGRPHSDVLRVEERYQRVDREHLMATVIIDDPKMYTRPWTALSMSLRLQSPTFDIREMVRRFPIDGYSERWQVQRRDAGGRGRLLNQESRREQSEQAMTVWSFRWGRPAGWSSPRPVRGGCPMMSTVKRLVLVTIVISGTAVLTGQGGGPQTPPILIDSLAGADSFELYCAACHGSGGRGDGPVASSLRTPPPDLATLARRDGGAFPAERVREFVMGTGRPLAAHGTTEMPVWGPMFRAFESDARARERITNLVAHIGSIQVPSTAPGDAGSQLFRTFCASCHGTTGRGNGPLAEELRRMPPDLTQFTKRNGGMFPSERVYRIIEGRDVSSHGDREMPVWGDVFRMAPAGSGPGGVKARIDAVVRYLEGIQERGA